MFDMSRTKKDVGAEDSQDYFVSYYHQNAGRPDAGSFGNGVYSIVGGIFSHETIAQIQDALSKVHNGEQCIVISFQRIS